MFDENKYDEMVKQIKEDVRAPLTPALEKEFEQFCLFMQLYETEQRLIRNAFERCLAEETGKNREK